MDLNLLISHLGEPITSLNLVNVLAANGVGLARELALPEGEFRTYIEGPAEGFSLVFTDEAMFLGRNGQPIGIGPLYFSGIFLYAEGKDDYSQYRGQIPFDIDFLQDHDSLVARLGMPSWQRLHDDGTVAADRWDGKAAFRIHITYSLKSGMPVLISLQRPDLK